MPQRTAHGKTAQVPYMADTDKLDDLRASIDAVDTELLALINRRAELAKRVADVKARDGDKATYLRPEREAQVLRRLTAANPGPLGDASVVLFFRELMSACLAIQRQLKVAYLGPSGTFTETAAFKQFGHGVSAVACHSIAEVFREVEVKACDFGVVPVENSLEGVVNNTLDSFVETPLKICGELELPIHHQLLSNAEADTQIQRVYGHQQALAQCRAWLDTHLAQADRVAVSSNGEAARRAAEESATAAIAGTAAGDIYALNNLAANIEDDPSNTTRFLVIGYDVIAASGKDKTSVLFSTENKPGALHYALSAFAEAGISLTRIESRPARGLMWEYLFFVDIEGHAAEDSVARALAELEGRSAMTKLLGSYPCAVV